MSMCCKRIKDLFLNRSDNFIHHCICCSLLIDAGHITNMILHHPWWHGFFVVFFFFFGIQPAKKDGRNQTCKITSFCMFCNTKENVKSQRAHLWKISQSSKHIQFWSFSSELYAKQSNTITFATLALWKIHAWLWNSHWGGKLGKN